MATRSLPIYQTGLVTATSASAVVTGSATAWTTTINGVTESVIAAGDWLVIGTGRPIMIQSVDSATQITLQEPWPHTTATSSAYKIYRYVALPTGSVLAALQTVEARGSDTNPLTTWTLDGGSTRLKLRQATGGQAALAVGATGASDGALVDALVITSAGLVGVRGVPSEELDVIRSQNATTTARVYNATVGASAMAEWYLQTGTTNATAWMRLLDGNGAPQLRLGVGAAVTGMYLDSDALFLRSTAGTEQARLDSAGRLGIGSASLTGVKVRVAGTVDGAASAYGVRLDTVFDSASVTTAAGGFLSTVTANGATSTLAHFQVSVAASANPGVATQVGFLAPAGLAGSAANYGFQGLIANASAATISNVARTSNVVTITTSAAHGFTVGQSVLVAATTQTGVNTTAVIESVPTTSSFTYTFAGGNIASTSDTGSVNSAGRWNLYMSGSAPNYMAGNLLLGYTASQGSFRLQVNSQIFATSATIATSDSRFKASIVNLEGGMEAIRALRPVEYDFMPHPVHNLPPGRQLGFLAQEIETALAGKSWLPSLVHTAGLGADEFKGLAETKLLPLAIRALQELDARLAILEAA